MLLTCTVQHANWPFNDRNQSANLITKVEVTYHGSFRLICAPAALIILPVLHWLIFLNLAILLLLLLFSRSAIAIHTQQLFNGHLAFLMDRVKAIMGDIKNKGVDQLPICFTKPIWIGHIKVQRVCHILLPTAAHNAHTHIIVYILYYEYGRCWPMIEV